MTKMKAGNYHINTDSNGNVWITETVVSNKTGKPYEKRVSGYRTTFKSALRSMIERKTYRSDVTTLEEMIDTISNALNEALKIIEEKEI